MQTSASKSLPNTPKTGEVQVKQDRTRACSAVVDAKRTKNDFSGLDAFLERKQLEKHDAHSAGEDYSNNSLTSCDERFNLEYSMRIQDHADAPLHQSADNYSTSLPFSTQNEENLLSSQYQETSKSSSSLKTESAKDIHHISSTDLPTGVSQYPFCILSRTLTAWICKVLHLRYLPF